MTCATNGLHPETLTRHFTQPRTATMRMQDFLQSRRLRMNSIWITNAPRTLKMAIRDMMKGRVIWDSSGKAYRQIRKQIGRSSKEIIDIILEAHRSAIYSERIDIPIRPMNPRQPATDSWATAAWCFAAHAASDTCDFIAESRWRDITKPCISAGDARTKLNRHKAKAAINGNERPPSKRRGR